VKTIVDALTAMGRLQNTMIVFSSDNGLTWAEHRLIDTKYTPYEESIRVPLVIRYDPLMHGRLSDEHLVVNVDLAATMADIAGIAHPPTEGLSMLPLFSQGALGAVNLRTDFLIEHHAGTAPPYCGIRSKDYMYT